jgi:hypothetical protein
MVKAGALSLTVGKDRHLLSWGETTMPRPKRPELNPDVVEEMRVNYLPNRVKNGMRRRCWTLMDTMAVTGLRKRGFTTREVADILQCSSAQVAKAIKWTQ